MMVMSDEYDNDYYNGIMGDRITVYNLDYREM
jgi:hypothetical protein